MAIYHMSPQDFHHISLDMWFELLAEMPYIQKWQKGAHDHRDFLADNERLEVIRERRRVNNVLYQ